MNLLNIIRNDNQTETYIKITIVFKYLKNRRNDKNIIKNVFVDLMK